MTDRDHSRTRRRIPARNIVAGQRVTEAKAILARTLRGEMTPAERRLWGALRRNQVLGLHFRRSQIIDGFIADFYCHAAGLVVEVDGPIHEQRRAYDAERDTILAARNLRILRVTNDEVLGTLPTVVARIKEMVESEAPLSSQKRGRGRGHL